MLDDVALEGDEPTAEDRKAHLAFLRGDCHRQLAVAAIEAEGGQASEQATPSEPELAYSVSNPRARHHLETAERLFGEAIDLYAQTPPQSDADRNCERLAVFGRAHCVFDLGRYEEAIALYQQAAARYRDDLSILTASLQIASANAALGRADDLRNMGQELRRLLERIPAEASAGEGLSLPRSYWHRWLKHVEASGLW